MNTTATTPIVSKPPALHQITTEDRSMTTRIDFRYLSEPDMIAAGVTDMPACVDAMEETFVLLHKGDYRMAGPNSDSHGAMITFPDESPFEGMPANTADRRFMAMPAYLGGSFGTSGMKWYGSNVANRDKGLPRSILMFMLNDTDTGAPLALMSANLLSAYRTGAVPGVGARHLARPDSRVVGIVGPGVMARTSLSAFVATCPMIDTLKIKGRSRSSIDAFTAWVRDEFPQITTILEVETLGEAVHDSDIVTFCTTGVTGDPATYPTIRREDVKPGAFLSMPAPCNIDAGMQTPDVRKVVDNVRLYEAWAEETGHPSHHTIPIIGCKFMDMIHDGAMAADDLVDLGAVAAGDAVGRRSDDEIVVFSVGGMPVEDVAWGTVIYRNAVAKGIGTILNLWDSPALA
ncbi:ornithine cyclodeaminase [Gordonia polyisoprenivorans VH2]|uniref:Ornithine cyclodeaminase n=2 Tax=Gordoniaceae TaxID=85026 RepID=H6MYB5_GORPV|nr:tyramine oxidase subunit B [Gordonia polyisoprenivorans]AFA74342.1 ornithine cyclodeaminase [Gordonia polyisoprenivorans VH2]OPX14215.1 ornithine cyclodeaminase [Gordonia sp. i37]